MKKIQWMLGMFGLLAGVGANANSTLLFRGKAIVEGKEISCQVSREVSKREDEAPWVTFEDSDLPMELSAHIVKETSEPVAIVAKTFTKVEGSRGFGSYTPGEKSTVQIEVKAQDLNKSLLQAKLTVENCVERTFLGRGTGTYRCKTTTRTCLE